MSALAMTLVFRRAGSSTRGEANDEPTCGTFARGNGLHEACSRVCSLVHGCSIYRCMADIGTSLRSVEILSRGEAAWEGM